MNKLEHRVETAGEIIKWTSHPFVERPVTSIAVILFIGFVALMVRILLETWFYALLSLFLIITSLAKYFFPTHYELTPEGIRVESWFSTQQKEWSAFKTFYKSSRGIVLSPFEHPSPLDSYRGIYLLCERNINEVINFVSQRLKKV
ncbi:MAG: hypothetical protein N2246_06095 [Candidatus Sumerlaeia bacterium]|nr:hypothetical protein [Candidatus Sumerlaeia bacterium]